MRDFNPDEPVDDSIANDASPFAGGEMPLAMAYMLVYMIVGMVFYHAVPGIEASYRGFNSEPPAITQAVLRFAHWFREGYGWLWLLPVPFGLPLALAKIGSRGPGTSARPRRRWRSVHLSSIVLLAAAILVVASLVFPLTTMAPDFKSH